MFVRLERGRGPALLASLLGVLAALLAVGQSTAEADLAAPMYQPGSVVEIDLTLSQESIDELEADPDEYVRGAFSMATTDGTPGGVEETYGPLEIGVRLKGSALSTFRTLAGKSSFKLKFNEFVKGQKLLGLKKMTLNNMVEDTSMVHETLAYAAFRAAGVPASRTGYAQVDVNGEDFGLYLNLETLDDVSMERMFGPFDDPQHLYEGEKGVDLTPGSAEKFEVDEGDEGDIGDLEALIAAAAESAPFSQRMAAVADLGEMAGMWAVEKYVGHWDGYAGREGLKQPNNYYLVSDPVGMFKMIPSGPDLTWDQRIAFDAPAGVLFDGCLADESCLATYRQALAGLRQPIASLDLDALAQSSAALLAPWQELEQLNSRHEHGIGEAETALAATRDFIADRPAELNAWLGPEYGPPTPKPTGPDPLPAPPLSGRALWVGRATVREGVLVARVNVPSAGRLGVRAGIRTRAGLLAVCGAHRRVGAAGPAALRCGLSRSARRHIAARRLKLLVDVDFAPDGGSREGSALKILVPRAVR
jgi:hypothetical protein